MEIRQLRLFISICEQGGFTAAAKHLDYSQSAVSDAINNLEKSLDCRLFERLGRGVSLTLYGQKLLPLAYELIDKEEQILHIFNTKNEILRIGITESLSVYKLPSLLQNFASQHPDITIQIEMLRSEEIPLQLRLNHIDIGLTLDDDKPDDDMEVKTLFEEEIVFIYEPLMLGNLGLITYEDLDKRNAVISKGTTGYNFLFHQIYKLNGIALGSVINIESIEGIKNFVANGFGLGFLPLSTVEQDFKQGRLDVLRISGQTNIHYGKIHTHRNKYKTRGLESFYNYICKEFQGSK